MVSEPPNQFIGEAFSRSFTTRQVQRYACVRGIRGEPRSHDSHRGSSLRKPAQLLRRSFTRTAARARHDSSLSTDRRPGLLLDLEKYRAREKNTKICKRAICQGRRAFLWFIELFLAKRARTPSCTLPRRAMWTTRVVRASASHKVIPACLHG